MTIEHNCPKHGKEECDGSSGWHMCSKKGDEAKDRKGNLKSWTE